MDVLWLGQSECHEVSAAFERHAQPAADVLHTDLREILSEAYTRLAEQCGRSEESVAVRSSAVDEDGRSASFAGQYETYLNIIGIKRGDSVTRRGSRIRLP